MRFKFFNFYTLPHITTYLNGHVNLPYVTILIVGHVANFAGFRYCGSGDERF